MRIAVQLVTGLLDLVYPPCCLVCGARMSEGVFCAECRQSIKPIPPPFCDRCGAPITPDRQVCAVCEEGHEPPFAWSQALGQYTGTLRDAVHRLKYHGKRSLAEPLGQMLAASMDIAPSPLLPADPAPGQPAFDAVIPVPLDAWRMRQRGFNQAEKIARVVARERGWRLQTDLLARVRRTPSQTALSSEARAENVHGAFTAHFPHQLTGLNILLVDDVITTGATVRACAEAARAAGAARICVVALARGL